MFAQEGENMEEHIQKLRGLQQTLHAMGELISDWDFSNTLLMSLPQSWSTFITAVNAGLPTLTSDSLIAHTFEEYKSRQAGSGGMALKGAEQDKKSINDSVPRKGNAEIVAKRATGSKIVRSQGETKRVKPPNGGNLKKRPNKQKKSLLIMTSHLRAQKPVQWQSPRAIG